MKENDEYLEIDEIRNQIIKTPYFERLKNIKQLGFVFKICVYKNFHSKGSHTRYEHCKGTYSKAREFLEVLEKHSEVKISNFHKKCVMLAGLLHDIGHGPFSHFWEHFNSNYKHEQQSEYPIDEIFLKIRFDPDPQIHENGVMLIKALIQGKKELIKSLKVDGFLFEIINNKRNGIDVDKWDYLIRDYENCKQLLEDKDTGIFERYVDCLGTLFTNVKISEDREHIEYSNWKNVEKLFECRQTFYKNIYLLPEAEFLGEIIKRALDIAWKNGHTFKGKNLKLMNSADEEFLSFTDDEVMEFLAGIDDEEIQKYIRCFNNLNLVEEIKAKKMNSSVDDNIVVVNIEIQNVGDLLPKEENISFYDNGGQRRSFEKGFATFTHFFRIKEN